jgi:hypothetical protein
MTRAETNISALYNNVYSMYPPRKFVPMTVQGVRKERPSKKLLKVQLRKTVGVDQGGRLVDWVGCGGGGEESQPACPMQSTHSFNTHF